MKFACVFISAAAAMATLVASMPYTISPNPNPYSEHNKDGSETPLIRLRGPGESGEYDKTAEVTVDEYTVSKKNGTYFYMEFDSTSGTMVSSGLRAVKDDPEMITSKRTGKKLGKNEHKKRPNWKGKQNEANQRRLIANNEENNRFHNEHSHVNRRKTSVIGNKKNLMIPFKFSNHASRPVPSIADLTVLMNNVGPHATLCPTGSVRDVYLASSYNQLVLDTTVAPWVILPNNETYYAPGNSGLSAIRHIMIQDALNALQATGFDFRPFDTDSDGFVDYIGFVHSGYGAEWGGTDAYGTDYKYRIWSHKATLITKWTSTSGKSVTTYHISPSVWGTSGSEIGHIGVIAHETGHFLGLPDLYDGSVGSGIGSFCLMGNSWGFDGSQMYPPLMSAWAKIQLGWVIPTVITTAGTYTARQACTYPDVFQISANFSSGEFLLIENRQRCSFDAMMPGPGLAIFHIDAAASYTTEGYPGQTTGWPTNAQHYRVALLQADGNYDLEKGGNRGDRTDLFFSGGVNGITTAGTTDGLAYPNTKAYKGGIILETGIGITQIGAASASMSFVVSFGALPPTLAPTMPPVNQFRLKLVTDKYPGETGWSLYQTSPSVVLIAEKDIGFYTSGKTLYNEVYYLSPGNYQFDITDEYNDGITEGGGNYEISFGGTILKSGSAFGAGESTSFTVEIPVPAKPVTSKPVSSKPVTAKPISARPITAGPVSSKPVIAAPIDLTGKPITKIPVTTKPTTKKPATANPTTSKPATAKPITAKPITAMPVTSKPVIAEPIALTGKPITEKPVTAKSTTTNPVTAKPILITVDLIFPVLKSAAPVSKPVASVLKPLAPVTKRAAPVSKPAARVAKPTCVATARACTINSACCSKVCRKKGKKKGKCK